MYFVHVYDHRVQIYYENVCLNMMILPFTIQSPEVRIFMLDMYEEQARRVLCEVYSLVHAFICMCLRTFYIIGRAQRARTSERVPMP